MLACSAALAPTAAVRPRQRQDSHDLWRGHRSHRGRPLRVRLPAVCEPGRWLRPRPHRPSTDQHPRKSKQTPVTASGLRPISTLGHDGRSSPCSSGAGNADCLIRIDDIGVGDVVVVRELLPGHTVPLADLRECVAGLHRVWRTHIRMRVRMQVEVLTRRSCSDPGCRSCWQACPCPRRTTGRSPKACRLAVPCTFHSPSSDTPRVPGARAQLPWEAGAIPGATCQANAGTLTGMQMRWPACITFGFGMWL